VLSRNLRGSALKSERILKQRKNFKIFKKLARSHILCAGDIESRRRFPMVAVRLILFLLTFISIFLCVLVVPEKETRSDFRIEADARLSLQGSYLITLLDPEVDPAYVLEGIGTAEEVPECNADGECTVEVRYSMPTPQNSKAP